MWLKKLSYDKIIKKEIVKKGVTKMAEKKNEIVKKMAEIELVPTIFEEETTLVTRKKIPYSRLAGAGTAFDSISAAFQYVTSGGQATSGLYQVTVPNGGTLMKFKDGRGFLGSVQAANGGVGGGQAVLNPVIVNPATLCMAVALISIDKKLDGIQETQKEMFDYLKVKDKAKLQGDIIFLTDIVNNYKYHWNNDTFKQVNLIKTQDIKQTAEASIEQYRSLIKSKAKKKGLIQTSQQVKEQLEELKDYFRSYSMALYLHAFSSFLEVMLLENFDENYLNSITNKIEKYSIKYRELYTDSYNQLESQMDKSLQGHIMEGLAKVNIAAGEVLEKIPIVEKSPLDEGLHKVGYYFSDTKDEGIVKAMKKIIPHKKSQVDPFIQSVKAVKRIYNEPLQIVFDEENLYIDY